MGIPVVLPTSPSPRPFANHSAKPSWSNGSLSSSSSPSPSTSSSSSIPASSRYHRLLHDTRPPLSTLAYVPPPSAPWGAGTSPDGHHDSISPSEPTFNADTTSSLPPLLPSQHYTSTTGTVFLSTLTSSPPSSLPSSIASGLELSESPPPRATTNPSRVRVPPNLRRISRVPVFVTAPSTLAVVGPAQVVSSFASSSLTTTSPSSSQRSSALPGPPSPPQQHIWHPSSPSLAYYLTRPLPPPPPPLAQPMVSEDNARYDHNSNHHDSGWNTDSYTAAAAAAAAAAARIGGRHVTSSTTGTNVNNYLHDPDLYDNFNNSDNNNNNNNNMNSRASQLSRSYSTILQSDSAVYDSPTNGRYVNRDHPDNQNRPDLADLYSEHHHQDLHGHYNPQRARQQPYQQQFGVSVSYPETIYSRTRVDTGGEGDLEDAVDPEYESSSSASSSAPSRLMDRRARMRPRERERERERERGVWSSSAWTSSTVPMANTPDFLRGYVVDDDETTQASISSNSQSVYSLGSSGTVRRTGRTLIRADAIHPGVIHIYPENHAPIWMYGRPILSSSPSSDGCLPSPPSSDTNSGSGGGSESEPDEAQLLSILSNHSDLAIAATDRDMSPPLMLPRPPPSASASATVSRRQLNRYTTPHE